MVAAGAAAHAQAAAPDASAKPAAKPAAKSPARTSAGKTVDAITVTGASQNGMRTSIDRRSYGVANDLATTTGSISDALKNIPSVEVDVQGNVSLRGDTNVTIMVDGKPSAMFRGASAAQALQSMPADQIERVEVMTNPSAQFSPEGSAGIINLVTKQSRKAGKSGSIRANVGGAGRHNFGASGAYNNNKLTVSGDVGARRDPQHSVNTDDRAFPDPVTGLTDTSHTDSSVRGPLQMWNARVSADYDLDGVNRISAELRHNTFNFDADTQQRFQGFGPTGALTQVINQGGLFANDRSNNGGQVSYRRKLSGDDHNLTVNLSREQTDERNKTEFTTVTEMPAAPDVFQSIRARNSLTQTELKADYNRPMPGEARLKTGYDLRVDDNRYDNIGVKGVDTSDATLDPIQTNLFLYKQTINAAYGTYEKPLGDWTVLGGLRLEDVKLDLNQVTTRLASSQDYFRIYPSLHLAYKFADNQQLILSYSHRVQRPSPQDLNPFRFVGTFSAREGNPDLKPQQTDSY
jgi:outer membrane cobalamin receptor